MSGFDRIVTNDGIMQSPTLNDLDQLLAEGEPLTLARVSEYLATHRLATANWFGPTGRPDRSSWIKREGLGWRVWDTDERAVIMDFSVLRTDSEAEALDSFLRRARNHLQADGTAVRRGF
ncbi:hypothetical protein [Paenarthrobacter aurescens]|nr:hypothetical protein [Paenarthrobacter aurescens]